jgi:hypothetical protein
VYQIISEVQWKFKILSDQIDLLFEWSQQLRHKGAHPSPSCNMLVKTPNLAIKRDCLWGKFRRMESVSRFLVRLSLERTQQRKAIHI